MRQMTDTWESHVAPHGPLVEVVPGLWQITGFGPPMDRNMVVWRLPDGGLWLHSVVALDEPTLAAVQALGPPRVMVVPNGFHRRDPAVWKRRFPELLVLAPAASRARIEVVVPVDATCEERSKSLGVRFHVPDGVRPGELAYELDVPGGRALVVTDLLFNLPTAPPGFAGFVLNYITASIGPLGISRVFRLLALQDRAKYAAFIESLAGIEDLRVLSVAHGDAVTSDVSAALRAAATRIRG